jgi:hypothetical protein
MVIRMSYRATPNDLCDKRDDYITSFAYQMTCGDGWETQARFCSCKDRRR